MRIKYNQLLISFTFAIVILLGLSLSTNAQVPDGVLLSLKSGDARSLARHFNSNVELTVLNHEDIYSKGQAEQLVRNFFSKYHPDRFALIHQGTQEGRPYAIGNLQCGRNTFRVSFLLRKTGKDYLIHMLRIEKIEQ